jgi:zinc-binding in reverse transcriptase
MKDSFLDFDGVLIPEYVHLWKAGIPLIIRIFLWLVFHQKILTKDTHSKKGWSGDLQCLCAIRKLKLSHTFLFTL